MSEISEENESLRFFCKSKMCDWILGSGKRKRELCDKKISKNSKCVNHIEHQEEFESKNIVILYTMN